MSRQLNSLFSEFDLSERSVAMYNSVQVCAFCFWPDYSGKDRHNNNNNNNIFINVSMCLAHRANWGHLLLLLLLLIGDTTTTTPIVVRFHIYIISSDFYL